jgi:hypothetical protein
MKKNIMKKKEVIKDRYHDFHWNTQLTGGRMEQIKEWVNSLTDEQYNMLQDVIKDARDEGAFSADEGC